MSIRLVAVVDLDDEGWSTNVSAITKGKPETWQVAVAETFRQALVDGLDSANQFLESLREEPNGSVIQPLQPGSSRPQ